MMSPEAQVESYFARYESTTAGLGRALRAKLRARLPGLSEVVYLYENQGSLVISYSPTGRGYEGLCSLAVHADKVLLYFTRGAELSKADPNRLLQGRGKTVRHVVMNAVEDFERREIEELMMAALELTGVSLDPSAQGSVIIKSEARR